MPRVSAGMCVRILSYALKRNAEESAYRVYVTDALYAIAYNSAVCAQHYGGGGRHLPKRYVDIVNPKPEDNRTSEDIINSMKSKLQQIGSEA